MRAVVAKAAAQALTVIEPVYGMSRPADDDTSRRARTYRATYELHDRAAEHTSVLFTQQRFDTASELLLGGSIFPAMQNFLLAARAQGLGDLPHELGLLRGRGADPRRGRRARRLDAGRPRRRRAGPEGGHGPLRRHPVADVAFVDQWDRPVAGLLGGDADD